MTDIDVPGLELLQASDPSLVLDPRQQLVDQLAESDPRLGALAKLWLARREERTDEPASSEAAEQRRRDFEKLNRVVRKLYSELEVLRERNDLLAAALGACYLCWGRDALCPVCTGRGTPGYIAPDSALFAQFALRAARWLRPSPQPRRRTLEADSGEPQQDLESQPNTQPQRRL